SAITLVANIERVGIGEPDTEGKRGGRAGGGAGKSRQNVQRNSGQFRGRAGRQGTGSACLINRVNAIAATALGDVERVVEDGEAAEVGVFARLVGAKLETAD